MAPARLAVLARLLEHQGPGPHPSGSPQAVHGGGASAAGGRPSLAGRVKPPASIATPGVYHAQDREDWGAGISDAHRSWRTGLSDEERRAFRVFTEGGYMAMSAAVRGQATFGSRSEAVTDEIRGLATAMQEAMRRAPTAEWLDQAAARDGKPVNSRKVHRGLSNITPETVERWKAGGEIELEGFSSTTPVEATAERFTAGALPGRKNVMFHVNQRTGVSVRLVSQFAQENEIILMPGSRYRIRHAGTRKGMFGEIEHFELEEVLP